ncbi:MAG TPA: MFS transporter [Candidatus Limnocylindrales bacterium]|nr:MFS transporter [Candidatus Limnocylindrales bacterium]
MGTATAGIERPAEAARRPWMPPDAVMLGVSMFCVVAATNIMTPLLPQIRDDLGVSITTAGLIVASFGLARLLVDLPAGFLASNIAPKVLTLAAVAALIVSSAIGIGAATVETLILARVVSGIGVAILATVILAALSALATPANRGKVMSLYPMANNLGIAFYPILGGIIGVIIGWRATFAVNAVLAVVAGVLLLPMLGRIDLRRPKTGKAAETDDKRVLYGSRRTVALAVTNGGVVANMIHRHGVRNTILPLYAATVLGLGGVSIAVAIALMAITGFLVMAPGGSLGDRVGRRRVISVGLFAIAIGDLLFLFTGELASFLLVAALIGCGDFFASSQTALLSEIVPAEQRTFVLSGYRFSSDLGALIGPIMLAFVMDTVGVQAAIIAASAILLTAAIAARVGVPARIDLAVT